MTQRVIIISVGSSLFQTAGEDTYYILDQYYTGQETICKYSTIPAEEGYSEPVTLTSDKWGIPGGYILGMDTAEQRKFSPVYAVMTVPALPFTASFTFAMEVISTLPSLTFSR